MIYQNTLRYVAGTLEALAESVWLARGIACHQDAEASGELPKSAAAFFFLFPAECASALPLFSMRTAPAFQNWCEAITGVKSAPSSGF